VLDVEEPDRSDAAPRASTMGELERLDFATVYAQHVGFVWRALRGLGVSPEQVADAAQDVFMVVHRRLPDFDARHPIQTWLFAIARRIAANYRRKHQRARTHEPLDERIQDNGPDPAETSERRAARQLMAELLDQLDDDKRAIVVLAEIEQLTAPQIAAITGIRLSTVYTHLYRARRQLSRALALRQKGTG
jgi:RNA polymerase sigma-70 factor (ECF subfamily)